MMTPPLRGLRVIDFTRLLPGPHATMLLADMGADVIKIEDATAPDYLRFLEPLVGDVNVAFAYLNRGKRSVTLDLRQPDGIAAARRLIAGADVLVESFRPGMMARMGLDAASLADLPRLVYCSMSGYGQSGPYRNRAGHDINYIATAGVASLTSPAIPALQLADIGGALHAVIAILAALLRRERGGEGAWLDVSLTEAAMGLLSMHAAEALHRGTQPAPAQGLLWGRAPAYRCYRCADGRMLAVGALEDKFWSRLCHALDLPQLEGDGLAEGPRAALVIAQLEARFLERDRDAWLRTLHEVDACVEPVLDIDAAFHGELALARGMTVEVSVGGRRVTQPASPLPFKSPPEGPARLGEHTRALLEESGYSAAEIEQMARRGILGDA